MLYCVAPAAIESIIEHLRKGRKVEKSDALSVLIFPSFSIFISDRHFHPAQFWTSDYLLYLLAVSPIISSIANNLLIDYHGFIFMIDDSTIFSIRRHVFILIMALDEWWS